MNVEIGCDLSRFVIMLFESYGSGQHPLSPNETANNGSHTPLLRQDRPVLFISPNEPINMLVTNA